jgi:hypothetical protein
VPAIGVECTARNGETVDGTDGTDADSTDTGRSGEAAGGRGHLGSPTACE